jgi:2-methoxy-6-polyprenyl-1,4-benzoquinol methylase
MSPPPQYLVESIRKFPKAQRFADMIREAGFTVLQEEQWEPLTFGVACIHTGVKL